MGGGTCVYFDAKFDTWIKKQINKQQTFATSKPKKIRRKGNEEKSEGQYGINISIFAQAKNKKINPKK